MLVQSVRQFSITQTRAEKLLVMPITETLTEWPTLLFSMGYFTMEL